MILHTQPNKPWTEYDFLLLEANQILEMEKCPQCGLPKWICHNDDGDLDFRVRKDVCYAMREVETSDRDDSSAKGYEKPPGTVARPEPYRPSGKTFDWSFREGFYRAEYEKQQAIALATKH